MGLLGKRKTLEDFINEVDYAFLNEKYVPSIEAIAFISFIKLVNGAQGEENKSPVIHLDMIDQANQHDECLFVSFRGSAKALALTEKILTPNGNVPMRDIHLGAIVYDRNGETTQVITESKIFNKPMYLLKLEDGRELKVSHDHINIVRKITTGGKFVEHNLTTQEILDKGLHFNRKVSDKNPQGKEGKWYIPLNEPVQFTTKELGLDAYTTGVLLGDGSIGTDGYSRVHTHIDDVDELREYIPYTTSTVRHDLRNKSTVRFSLRGVSKQVKSFIGTANCYSKKIPDAILYGDESQRLECLVVG